MHILLIFLLLFITGCSEQFPPPEDAIVACIENGRNPIYISNINQTTFSCDEKHESITTQYR